MLKKADNNRKVSLALICLVSVLYFGGAFLFLSYLDCGKAKSDLLQTMQSVKSQYMAFKKSDTESEANNLMRLARGVKQLSKKLPPDNKVLSPQVLHDYAEQINVSGIIVMDEIGDTVAEYTSNEYFMDVLRKEVVRKPVLDVAKHEKKAYLRRIFLDDGSYLDLCAYKRSGVPGLLVCYDHLAADHIENQNLSLQNLLDDYKPAAVGTIVLSDGYKIIASNDEKLLGMRTAKNKLLEKLRKEGRRGELVKISAPDGRTYYGSLDRGRDFFAYIYYTEDQVYVTRWLKFGVVVAFYLAAACFGFYRRRRKQP